MTVSKTLNAYEHQDYSLICPNSSKIHGMNLEGDTETVRSKAFSFEAYTCVNSTNTSNDCESPEAIDEFIRDIEIKQLVVE